jgi:phosphohistidine phosphatase
MASAVDVINAVGWPDSKIPVMVVGHQPWLGEVASLLLTREEQDWTIKKSNVWWISHRLRDDGNEVFLKAVLSPEFFFD